MVESDLKMGRSRTSTFMVEVLFRGNCSMQGDVTWLEGEKKRSFRSLLELVSLIQEACEESGAPAPDYELWSWFDDQGRGEE